jgi:hypothetical protein
MRCAGIRNPLKGFFVCDHEAHEDMVRPATTCSELRKSEIPSEIATPRSCHP